ncbi:MAG: restriction endonuclease subunit S [Chamaesiphon sp.]|nr:restriction endonuclease subunit S [Chamaesiphon sp.]
MSDLPKGWATTNLGKIIELKYGKSLPAKDRQHGDIPVYGSNGQIGWHNTSLTDGSTILVGRKGSIGEVVFSQLPCFPIDTTYFIDDFQHISYKYLISLLKSLNLNTLDRSTGIPGINRNDVYAINIPLPPLAEQRRIVAKLDSLLDRSRRARQDLERIPKLLDRYKQAILSTAFSGDLTEVSLSKVCLSITDGDHQAPPRVNEGIPFITISAINDGFLRLEKATRFVPDSYFNSLSLSRKPGKGDILFSVTGSIGIPVIVDTYEPFIFQRHIAILKTNKDIIIERYLFYILGSTEIKNQALEVATGTAQLTIPLGGLRNFQIPLPTLVEQEEIVKRIEKLFKVIDLIAKEYHQAIKLLDRLDRSILAKAFRGELVPQDPNDEPAAVLLERIQADRSAQVKGKKVKSK